MSTSSKTVGEYCVVTRGLRQPRTPFKILDEVLGLVARGVPCFPCRADKRPATPRGYKDATSDRATVEELWKACPGPLIGVPTGKLSGFDVLDIDARHRGDMWFREHRSRLPSTLAHRTRSGGIHLFFQHVGGLRCSAGRVANGVDIRADGGYVIWWPAVRLAVLADVASAPWPDWMLRRLLPVPSSNVRRVTVPDRHALGHLVRAVAGAREGERNAITFWAACRAGEMVASGLIAKELAADIITQAATQSGLSAAEAERTAWSGIRTTFGGAHV